MQNKCRLGLNLFLITQVISCIAAASVRVHPETVKAVMDANGTASFHCEVEGAGLGWLINGTDAQDFYGADVKIIPLGVVHGVVSYSSDLNVSTAEEFDNLQIVCRAIGTTKEETVDSNVAWLRLKDLVIPQCHNIQYNITENSIIITWLCGLVEHVELYYNVTISRDGENDSVIMQTNETFISFELEHPFAELCTNYTFSVVAWSVLDTSDASEPVNAGFHCPDATAVTPTPQIYNTAPMSMSMTPDPSVSATPMLNEDKQVRNLPTIISGILATSIILFAVMLVMIIIVTLRNRKQASVRSEHNVEHQCNRQGKHHTPIRESPSVSSPDALTSTCEKHRSAESESNSSAETSTCVDKLMKSQDHDPVYDVTSHVAAKFRPVLGVNVEDPNYQMLGKTESEPVNNSSSVMAPPGTQGLCYAQVCLNKDQRGGAMVPHAPPPTDDPVDYATIKTGL